MSKTPTFSYSLDKINVEDLLKEEEFDDPYCNPMKPVKVTFEDVSAAACKIRSGVIYTPCIKSHISKIVGIDIYLKKDFLQYSGSFKERGARYALQMLSEDRKKLGVIAASLGNHAQGISYHGLLLGVPVTVVMPLTAPIMKVQKCRDYRANVIVQGKDMAEAKKIALTLARKKNLTYINGYDHPHIIAGQGSVAMEIAEQVQNIDAVIVPVGGGGLIAGCATVLKTMYPNIAVIGVEAERCPSFTEALKAGAPCKTTARRTLADGLAVSVVGCNAFETARPLIDKMITVKEEWLAASILCLLELEKSVVEGGGAAGIAAILAGQLTEFKGKRVVSILSGGNIDTTILGRCIDRGLAVEGRLVKVYITVMDRPGDVADVCSNIAKCGASIKEIMQERSSLSMDVFSVQIKLICETRNFDHAVELRDYLEDQYADIQFIDFPKFSTKSTTDMFAQW